jgi:hypothetical protein
VKCAESDDLVRMQVQCCGAVNNATMRARASAHGHRRVPQIAASCFDDLLRACHRAAHTPMWFMR